MELIGFILLVVVGLVSSDSVQLSDNNVGDIVSVDINANALFSNQVDKNTINVIAGLFNQEGVHKAEEEKTGGDDEDSSANKLSLVEMFMKFLKALQESKDSDSNEDVTIEDKEINKTEATTVTTTTEVTEKIRDLPAFDKISPKLLAALAKFQNGKLMN